MRKERNEKKEEEEGIGIGSREQNGITLNGQRPFGTFPKINPFWKGKASLTDKECKTLLVPPSTDRPSRNGVFHPFAGDGQLVKK